MFEMVDKKIIIRVGIAAACVAVAGVSIFFLFIKRHNPSSESSENIAAFEKAGEILPGSVYTDGYVPMRGAVVVANNKKFVTDKDGAWASSGIGGGTEILVLAYGYTPYQGQFDSASPIILSALPTADIAVRVYNDDGSLMDDAFVILLDSNTREPSEILRPDQGGTAVFKNAPSGATIVFAIKKGYRLGWSLSAVDKEHADVAIVMKKRTPSDAVSQMNIARPLEQAAWKFPFVEEARAQDAGEEFERAFPDEYRLIIERDARAAAVEGIELSPDDAVDALLNDPNKKDWKSLGAEHLQFSDEIPEGYHLQRKMVDGKEVFVVETDVYTGSAMQRMFGMGVDYGELSAEAQARKKVQAESGGRPGFQLSVFWNWDKELSVEYATGLYDTAEDPVSNPTSPVMQEGGGMTIPATLYDTDGNIQMTPDVIKEFLEVAERIYEDNPQFSLTVNGSREPTVVVGEPFTIKANITLNHEPIPGWYILSPAALRGYFQSRWVDNPAQKFRGPGKITPYMVQSAPHRDTQFSKQHTERKEFTCLELGEETVNYYFQVSYRFAPKFNDPRGFVQPGRSHYNYHIPITVRCVGPKLLSRQAPDKCGNPATAVIRGRVGGERMEILDSVEVYMTKDGGGDVGSTYGSIDSSGAFEVSTPLSPGFYYYWVFGRTKNGHVYLLNEFEGTIEIKEKEEGKEGCDDEEEEEGSAQNVPLKTPPQSDGSSNCRGGGGNWVCPR